MVRLDLTPQDARVLRDVLEDYLSDLRMEISHTDSMDFRERLKVKKEVLRHIADALSEGVAGPPR